MQIASMLKDLKFDDKKPAISILLDNSYSKEIRITFRELQEMKEHKAPFPISIEVFRGKIEFGVNDETIILKDGDIITLDANVPHSLVAKKESIVRLSLNKSDNINRVSAVLSN